MLKLAKNIFLPSNALVKRCAGLSPNNAQPVKLEAKCAPEGAQLAIITDFFLQYRMKPRVIKKEQSQVLLWTNFWLQNIVSIFIERSIK